MAFGWNANFLQSDSYVIFPLEALAARAITPAFGSRALSHHPGTSSMGKLMALSLLTTLAAAVIFQPALMGHRTQGALVP